MNKYSPRGIFDEEPENFIRIWMEGKQSSGKSALVKAFHNYSQILKGEQLIFDKSQPNGRIDTIGLTMHFIPLELSNKSVMAIIEDCGSAISNMNKHLNRTAQRENHSIDIYLGVFSMIDAKSLEYLDQFLTESKQKKFHIDKFFLIGTHIDLFESYQITDEDLQNFSNKHHTTIHLIDLSTEQFGDIFRNKEMNNELKEKMKRNSKEITRISEMSDILKSIEDLITIS